MFVDGVKPFCCGCELFEPKLALLLPNSPPPPFCCGWFDELPNWKLGGGGVEEAPFMFAKGFEAALTAKLKPPPEPASDWLGSWKEAILWALFCC